jgi:enoyl-CoA hydratase/carnithine racemase
VAGNQESAMQYEQIECERRDGVLLLTLNRPERLNAWTPQMSAELAHAISTANDDAEVGAIVVTGAGRGFCAGADIEATFHARIEGQGDRDGSSDALDWVALVREAKPLIAAINGAAVGVGITMVLPFDVLMASEHARIGMFFVKMGLVPELASSHYLVQRMGFGRASEACLSGRLYSAQEAFDNQLVDRLVAADELLPTALGLARDIAANPGPQLRMVKQLLGQNGCETDLRLVQEREMTLLRECYQSAEHKEAVQAFLEKRTPKFS